MNENVNFLVLFFNDNTHQVHHLLPHFDEMTDIEIMDRLNIQHETIKKKYMVKGSQLPDIRYWTCLMVNNNEEMVVNKEKVINIKLKDIRDTRKSLFPELDLKYLIALQREDKNKQKIISQKSEYLRNIPQNIDFNHLSCQEIMDLDVFKDFTI